MSAKLLDRRAIKLSQMSPGQIAIGVEVKNPPAPYRPIYAKVYADVAPRSTTEDAARCVYLELTDLQNQYMDAVRAADPLVVLLEKNQIVELSV